MARGAHGVYAPIVPLSPIKEARPLAAYERFELGPFTDDMGGKIPTAIFRLLPMYFDKELAVKEIRNHRSGKTLLIRGKITHYEDASLLAVAVGPLEQVIARVELVDKASGKVLGTANCIGRTTETVNIGVEKKADGLAKAIVSWIDRRYPEDKRIKDDSFGLSSPDADRIDRLLQAQSSRADERATLLWRGRCDDTTVWAGPCTATGGPPSRSGR